MPASESGHESAWRESLVSDLTTKVQRLLGDERGLTVLKAIGKALDQGKITNPADRKDLFSAVGRELQKIARAKKQRHAKDHLQRQMQEQYGEEVRRGGYEDMDEMFQDLTGLRD